MKNFELISAASGMWACILGMTAELRVSGLAEARKNCWWESTLSSFLCEKGIVLAVAALSLCPRIHILSPATIQPRNLREERKDVSKK